MIASVDSGRDEARGLGVRSRDEEHRVLQEVQLEARGHEARDVRARGHDHFPREMAALRLAVSMM